MFSDLGKSHGREPPPSPSPTPTFTLMSARDTPVTPPSSKRRSYNQSKGRSLQLQHIPVNIPIPPSLIRSPYLQSMENSRRSLSSPRLPSEADDKWLQDTVPLSYGKEEDRVGSENPWMEVIIHEEEETYRSRSPQPRALSNLGVPSSPPLVCCSQESTPPTSWRQQQPFKSRSEPSISEISLSPNLT